MVLNKDRFRDSAHALIIGISSYVHVDRLPLAVRAGTAELAAVLADRDLGGYREDHICLLVDGEATRESILEALGALSVVDPDSTIFLYFSGHGGQAEAGETVFFLPCEADDASPRRLAETAISGEELAAALWALPAGRWIAIFDCCHAGGLADTRLPRGLPSPVASEYFETLVGRGRIVIASSRADERSWIRDSESPSVFTEHLLNALRGGARPYGPWIGAWELFEHIQPRVTADRPDQHPVLNASLEENFPIALYLGGARSSVDDDVANVFHHHAYLSYVDQEPDSTRVWELLLPRLEQAGLDIAVSGDVEEPGAHRVVGVERGIESSRRTVVLLSDAYLDDGMAKFIDALAQTRGLEEGIARLIPVHFSDFDPKRLPARLRMLVSLDLGHRQRGQRNLGRLIRTLRAPLATNRI